MRRIYESRALHRDDDEHHAPGERDDYEPQAMRSVNGSAWSRRLVPNALRYRAISLTIETPGTDFHPDEPVPFRVTMKNSLPVPVTIATRSPVLWTWHVDGIEEAAHVPLQEPPDETGGLHFSRGETKQFTRRWRQSFKVSESEWEPADPGEYTLGAAVNVADADEKGLTAETTVRLLDD